MSINNQWLIAAVVSVPFLVSAAEPEEEKGFDKYVGAEVELAFESKILSYGLPDSDKPNFVPYGGLTFFDVFSVGGKFLFDMTDIGDRMGRGNRTWDCWEIDIPANVNYTLTPEKVSWLPTSVELGAGYRYEYHARRTKTADTQFWLAEVSLPDLWLVPCLSYERDTIRDEGTYLNLALSHDFQLLEGLDLTAMVWQGWGDRKRVAGYLTDPSMERKLQHAGLMDTQLRLSLTWKVTEYLKVSGYVAYSDFLFDQSIREASRNYIRQIDGGDRNHSWCFPVGLSLSLSF